MVGQQVIGDVLEFIDIVGAMIDLMHGQGAPVGLDIDHRVKRAAAPDCIPEGLLGQKHHGAFAGAPVLNHFKRRVLDVEYMGKDIDIGKRRSVDQFDLTFKQRP